MPSQVESVVYIEMNKPHNRFYDHAEDQMNQLPAQLHEVMGQLFNKRDYYNLSTMCLEIMRKVTEVQAYLSKVGANAMTSLSSEQVAGIVMFAQQLLSIYNAAHQYIVILHAKNPMN